MSATHELQLPLTEAAVRSLALGDMVYLSGDIVITAGLPTHQRILEHIDGGKPLPIDLRGAALFHLGSYSRDTRGREEDQDKRGEDKGAKINEDKGTRFDHGRFRLDSGASALPPRGPHRRPGWVTIAVH